MQKRSAGFAKLTRPRLRRAVARDRLFFLLDQARSERAATLVVGPPGAGKTTLVASWLDARKLKGLWYQLDSGDTDTAAFFHYLSLAAKPFQRRGQRPLPALTPEYLPDVKAFAHRFFRELFARLPAGATLVLDNYQELPADHVLHDIVAESVDEVPSGAQLIIVSRADLPPIYARLHANRAIAPVEWGDLRLSLDETRSLARLLREIDESTIEALHRQCDGWAAGLILMLAETKESSPPAGTKSPQAVFDYFAGTLFDRASEPLRKMLLSVAFLPYVRADWAAELSGLPEAGDLLESLYRRHFFTQRRDGMQAAYQFHALFQAFLRTRAARLLPEEAYAQIMRHSADLLRSAQEIEAAFNLDCDRSSWNSAADLLLTEAPHLVASGRWHTLAQSIARLPGAQLEARPWLSYWSGTALTPVDPNRAKRVLEEAFSVFARSGDIHGQMLSAAGVLVAIGFELRDFNGVLPWIDTLAALIDTRPAYPTADAELRVLAALLHACLYARPGFPKLEEVAARVLELIPTTNDVDQCIWAAHGLLFFAGLTGASSVTQSLISLLQPLLVSAHASTANIVRCYGALGWALYTANNFPSAIQAYKKAHAIAQTNGLIEQDFMVTTWRGYCEWRMGDIKVLNSTVLELEHAAVTATGYSKAAYTLLKAEAAAACKNFLEAIRLGNEVVALTDKHGLVRDLGVASRLILIDWLLGVEDTQGARARLNELEREIRQHLSANCYLLTFYAHSFYLAKLEDDAQTMHNYAMQTMREGRRYGPVVQLRWAETAMPHLCAYALERDIEPDCARELVQAYALKPPNRYIEYWPWPVKIRTLGTFDLVIQDQAPTASRKAPKRLLYLIKAIIALGGVAVPTTKLADLIWPDEDGDASSHSLDVALSRARKMLGTSDILQVQDGKVTLNRDLCWVDVYGFESVALDDLSDTSRIERACALYQGSFLAAEDDAPWAIGMRERLAGHFVRYVQALGAAFEQRQHWDRAASWYQRGIDTDPLMETFHQGLIRCLHRAGRRAEALSAYRKLRHTLSVVLGVPPSDETENLYQLLLA